MNIISTLLADDTLQADFWTKFLPPFRWVLFAIILLCAISIIITVLMQSNDSNNGIDAVMGKQESYYSQNKGSSRDGKLKLVTIIMSSIALVCTILYFVTELINKA